MITALGVTQVAGYGGLYYAFAVLAPKMTESFGWSPEWTYGGFAAGLLIGGLLTLAFLAGQQAPLSSEHDKMVRRFLAAHARLLRRYPSLHSSANNHRVSELAALLLVKLCAPELADLDAQTVMAELEAEEQEQLRAKR